MLLIEISLTTVRLHLYLVELVWTLVRVILIHVKTLIHSLVRELGHDDTIVIALWGIKQTDYSSLIDFSLCELRRDWHVCVV